MSENEGNGEREVETLRKKIQLGTGEIELAIELDPSLIKSEKFVKQQAKKIATELTSLGMPVDSTEITTENIQEKAIELAELRKRNKQSEIEAERNADPTRKASSGTLTLEGQGYSGGEGYDSYEEMIDDLHRRKASGSTEEERETASKILKELMRKTVAGKKQRDFPINIEGGEEATIEAFKKESRKRRKED